MITIRVWGTGTFGGREWVTIEMGHGLLGRLIVFLNLGVVTRMLIL